MIRKLTEQDHEQVLSFLRKEAAFNLFLIGDIEAFGYDQNFQELWGQFTIKNELHAVLLRFHDSFIAYARDSFQSEAFMNQFINYDHIKLSGKSEVVEHFENLTNLKLGKKLQTYFCECTTAKQLVEDTSKEDIKIATALDVDRIMHLRKQITEFKMADNSGKLLRQAIETNTGRTYYIEKNGKIIACASTSAENSLSAMVVGVCTHPNHRGNRYASQIVSKMIQDFTKEGRALCLFYSNPAAGRIYKRLGFEDIGTWTMYR
ncbi:GNAT family N-acetyltransferase [Bacillus cereus group sp. BfR-BA-01380]|uniref:GNAT family N-acetyltransferase n=1 Tax=Bacillus cereus group sp. BfR-BA-01380 TaxID=2920324 RepID=UPI001F589EBF|nr:GNAT family N-acetyltransferase [Bacillus cereus group sp. BfR-BA-01380]